MAPTIRPWRRQLVVAAVLAVAFTYGAWPRLVSPDPPPRTAAPGEFSADRAMRDVRAIALRPHPVGSPEMARVAEYIAARLEAPSVEVVRHDVGSLHNVVARVRGTNSTGAVLVAAHSDSVAEGPGAGDNATGAATVIEIMRVLTAGPQPRNDVIVLLDDGEEHGFLGSEAFAESHPWMSDVKVAIGLDTAAWGPPQLIQTSDDNGLVARAYARGARSPIAYGFISATNVDSEFENFPFRSRGIPAIEIEDTYADVDQHTRRDTAAAVDPGRVQQLGDQALGLTRTLADEDLTDPAAPSRVFHTLAGVGVVHYPVTWDVVVVGIAVVALVAAITIGVRRRRFVGRRLAAGAGAALALTLVLTLAGLALASIYDAIWPNPNPRLEEYLLPSSAPFGLAALVVLGALFALGYRLTARRLGRDAAAIGFALLLTAVTALLLAAAPGSEYVFAWPLVVANGTWLAMATGRTAPRWLMAVPAVVATVLGAPLLLDGYFSAGVANLPTQALAGSLIAGAFMASAFVQHDEDGITTTPSAGSPSAVDRPSRARSPVSAASAASSWSVDRSSAVSTPHVSSTRRRRSRLASEGSPPSSTAVAWGNTSRARRRTARPPR